MPGRIVIVLKKTLDALSYIHNQRHFCIDIKAGNIFIDLNGCVKLAYLEVVALMNRVLIMGQVHLKLNHQCLLILMETPVLDDHIHLHTYINTLYSFAVDIWFVGIPALEIAHGLKSSSGYRSGTSKFSSLMLTNMMESLY